jgi:hypothetical protein
LKKLISVNITIIKTGIKKVYTTSFVFRLSFVCLFHEHDLGSYFCIKMEDLLSAGVARSIGAPQYEKRKIAALEVEQTVKRLSKSNDEPRIRRLVDKVCKHPETCKQVFAQTKRPHQHPFTPYARAAYCGVRLLSSSQPSQGKAKAVFICRTPISIRFLCFLC